MEMKVIYLNLSGFRGEKWITPTPKTIVEITPIGATQPLCAS
jgi:hypothetical protein